MNWKAMLGGLADPYDLKARIFPGLLVVLPLAVPFVCVFGPKNVTLTAVVSLVGGCGAIYAIGNMARGLGKAVEERLVAVWGGMPTTIMLRHRSTLLEASSRAIYHELFRTKMSVVLPTAAEEAADPGAADDKYKGATRQLRELTRGKAYSLLLKENIAYGFHRNMLGVRRWGWLTSALAIVIGLIIGGAIALEPFAVHPLALSRPSLEACLTLGIAVPVWLSWFYFTEDAVRRVSYSYAERLFECLRSLPNPRTPSRSTNARTKGHAAESGAKA